LVMFSDCEDGRLKGGIPRASEVSAKLMSFGTLNHQWCSPLSSTTIIKLAQL
jgi:hypothetical protein